MTKRLGLLLVALMIVAALLSACSTKSRDAGENYIKAVLKGDTAKAQEKACSQALKDETAQFISQNIAGRNIHSIDLKYDIGKGGNNKEIIVTGSFKVGPKDDDKEVTLAESQRDINDVNNNGDTEEMLHSRIILTMKKDGSNWCVEKVNYEDLPLFIADAAGAPAPTQEAAPAATEAAPVVTEAAPVVTEAAPVVTEAAPVVTEAAPVATQEATQAAQ